LGAIPKSVKILGDPDMSTKKHVYPEAVSMAKNPKNPQGIVPSLFTQLAVDKKDLWAGKKMRFRDMATR
jgi:hypothetical protein